MKHSKFVTQFICAFAIALFIAGCEKKEQTKPEPEPPADTVLTDGKLIGKWEAVHSKTEYFDAGHVTESYETIKGSGYYENGRGPISRNWNDDDITMVTFSDDHRFSCATATGEPKGIMLQYALLPNGQWHIKDQETIRLIETNSDTTVFDGLWQYAYLNGKLNILYYEADTTGKTQESMTILIELEKQP